MFSRPLLTYALDADPSDGMAMCRALAPTARSLRVVLRVAQPTQLVLSDAVLRRFEGDLEAGDRALEVLHDAHAEHGFDIEGMVIPGLSPEALAGAVKEHAPDVIVFGRFAGVAPEVVTGWAFERARALGVATAAGAARGSSIARVLCPFDGHLESLAALAPFLRDHCGEAHTVVLHALGPVDPRLSVDRAVLREVTGVQAQVEIATSPGVLQTVMHGIEKELESHDVDLVIVATDFAASVLGEAATRLLLRALPSCAVLFVPPTTAPPPAHDGELDALDVVAWEDASIRLERIGALGARSPLPDQPIDVVANGVRIATLASSGGILRVPAPMEGVLGLGRAAPDRDPVAGLEVAVTVVRALPGRVALVDARLDAATLAAVRLALDTGDRTLVAVRLAPDEPTRAIRERWIEAGAARPLVLGVRDLLDEGDAEDVPTEVDAVRLCRAAARLRARGVCVDAIVAHDAGHARAHGFAVLAASAMGEAEARVAAAWVPPSPGGVDARLDALTASSAVAGNRFAIDLDNGDARRRLLALIDGATERLHAQWYIVEDDEIAREVEAALTRAAERGVAVRLLADSLYSLHGSFGTHNALLARLGAAPGITLRVSHPIDHLPTLEDLKWRDHRKIAVADGARGIVSGRNLGGTYYRGFAEARLTPASPWHDVPWLDASAWLEGPAVAELDASFLQAWVEAGGEPFDVRVVPPCGDATVRVVVHRGLADAYTLEAYLALIEAARERLIVVNSFPLHLEVQHALLGAIARGVRLSLLVGHARPVHGEHVPFAGGQYRSIADALVRTRFDALLDAGADVRELAIAPLAGWDPTLGVVRPHVHAKVLCADGHLVAIGSANLDVTAGYWESELLVVVDDPRVGSALDATLSAMLDAAVRIDPRDPTWRERAGMRAWLGRVWPPLLG